MTESKYPNSSWPRKSVLRLGFVPLVDCAPLVMAQELGLFKKYDLSVRLSRELGWITVRDKVLFGQLDAAHAVAGMPFAATLGLGCAPCECVTGVVLSLHGNAITVSNRLAESLNGTGSGLRAAVAETREGRTLTFGIVSRFSSHHHLLRRWLAAGGVNPDTDVRLVVVPSPQMIANLKAGHLDGFCAGEPWNSVAVSTRTGCLVATSAELDPGHPEKVLMVRRDFVENRRDEHEALIAALLEACEYCSLSANHERIAEILAQHDYVGVSPDVLLTGLSGTLRYDATNTRSVPDFLVFNDLHSNEPSGDKAARVMQQLRGSGFTEDGSLFTPALARRVFRADIFERAIAFRSKSQTPKKESESLETNLVLA